LSRSSNLSVTQQASLRSTKRRKVVTCAAERENENTQKNIPYPSYSKLNQACKGSLHLMFIANNDVDEERAKLCLLKPPSNLFSLVGIEMSPVDKDERVLKLR